MTTFKTDQEAFWAGEFGNQYIERNSGRNFLDIAINQFTHALSKASDIQSIIELGSNVGNNMDALHKILPATDLHAVELNKTAADILRKKQICTVYNESILDFTPPRRFDLSFTSGVLIHIAPEALNIAYEKLYQLSQRYILVVEYYNHVPQELDYRGHSGKLYRRDFAGELMQQHQDVKLIDYGFLYRHDPAFKRNEDIYYFLMQK